MKYTCSVCGYAQMDDVAYDENGDASFELCSCCGFQFGVDDDVEIEDGIFYREVRHTTCIARTGSKKVLKSLALMPLSLVQERVNL